MDFAIPFELAELEAASHELLQRNQVVDGYLRPVAWRGSEMISTSARFNRVHVAIACWQWPSYFDPAARMAGIRLKTADVAPPTTEQQPLRSQGVGALPDRHLSKHDAENHGYHDALMLDWRGHVAEATSANVFFAKGRTLHTPVPDCFLNGITRQTVIELARALDYQVIERTILPTELGDFDECFLTGTAAEITPVQSIDEQRYRPGNACSDIDCRLHLNRQRLINRQETHHVRPRDCCVAHLMFHWAIAMKNCRVVAGRC